ncbi:23S rRNA (pseudouridine(1915)-N(3))-methyltransferase RlmH [Mesomycoplasma molare]|uniref:Ribosomal RNA large subunit methyltransferase H n=1 Tax=Mesomycoplasma molare TaxID=171288 RepID=A0ABY5TU74_9BACT|nr:23S rRNA (pseudouridine(1915)-N(3))-methyltransferase RlmH [Mesomycoplasma molare]UWD34213.1 23S rRNA (pseudouridine(1915)-N(3))-methyltransferase RlmH [Mesomycoplasma molare]
MKITIIAVGKLQTKFQDIFNEYKKKIEFFSKLEVIEVKELNEENITLKKQKETEKILELIPKNSDIYLCSLKGKSYDSTEFSKTLERSNITFIIGGSNGLIEELILSKKIKFSNLTFPHQLFRIMLIEQIYRGFSILNNIKYHK